MQISTEFDPFDLSTHVINGWAARLSRRGAVQTCAVNQFGPLLIFRLNQHLQRLPLPEQPEFMYTPSWTRGIRNQPYGVAYRDISRYVQEQVWAGSTQAAKSRKTELLGRLNDRAVLDDELAEALDLKGQAVQITKSCQGWEADPDNSPLGDMSHRTLGSLQAKRGQLQQLLCQLLLVEERNLTGCPIVEKRLRDHLLQHIADAKVAVVEQLKINLNYQLAVLRVLLRNALSLDRMLRHERAVDGDLDKLLIACRDLADGPRSDKSIVEYALGNLLPKLDAPATRLQVGQIYKRLNRGLLKPEDDPDSKPAGATGKLFVLRQALMQELAARQEVDGQCEELIAQISANISQEAGCVRQDLLSILQGLQEHDLALVDAAPELAELGAAAAKSLKELSDLSDEQKQALYLAHDQIKQLYHLVDGDRSRKVLMEIWQQLPCAPNSGLY